MNDFSKKTSEMGISGERKVKKPGKSGFLTYTLKRMNWCK